MHIAQPLNPYSDMKNLGNHNKDYTRFFIRSTNQYVALCAHDYLQDLGINPLEPGNESKSQPEASVKTIKG